jgi:hypothetical protein
MLNRSTLLLVLSGLFAIAPWLQWHQQQALCMQNQPASSTSVFQSIYSSDTGTMTACPDVPQPLPWVHWVGVLSVACFAGFLFLILRGIVERRREQEMLRVAGVYVREEDLPLDE